MTTSEVVINCGACHKSDFWRGPTPGYSTADLPAFKMRLGVNSSPEAVTEKSMDKICENAARTRSPAYWRRCFAGDKWKDSEQFTIISMRARGGSWGHAPAGREAGSPGTG